MILWDGKPPHDDSGDGAFLFMVLTFAMWVVVILGQMWRAHG